MFGPLTREDIDHLNAALDDWEGYPSISNTLGNVMATVIAGNLPEVRAMKMVEDAKTKAEVQRRKDLATILRAKLLLLKRDIENQAAAAINEVGKEPA